MTGKFIRRTLRNVVLRDHPYFAHLALTHRCNLRCRFCHIQETRFSELDTAGMKRVIDVLDRMGVGVISVSGGGEPLLRSDFDEIVNYAAAKGLYTKLTSNGTMPRERYQRLLDSGIREIGISLDGVEGNDLPFSHCGRRLLDTIRYLHDNLPAGKQLTLNVTVSERNRAQVQTILDYCAREFPKAKVWLNPIVSGAGKLRTAALAEIEPRYLDECSSPTLLRARFYNDGVKRQWLQGGNWGCRAGRMFFDVKPNGDLWACQDVPCHTRLNVLDPDFEQQRRKAGFGRGMACGGCTYSCYMVTQQGLDPRNWKDMAGLWWSSNTLAGDPCRQAAERGGWVAGLLCLLRTRLLPASSVAAAALALLFAAGLARGESQGPLLEPEAVVERMERSSAERERRLPGFEGLRTYAAGNARLKREASLTVEFRYRAPASREFRVVGRAGSKSIQRMAIEPLMAAEVENASGKARRDVRICRANYKFQFDGYDPEAAAYRFRLRPIKPNKYLFQGTIWVDAAEFAIRRIEGEPAKSPSFWVKRTRFVHEYEPVGGYWLPARHRSQADLRLFGNSTLAIHYSGYRLLEPRESMLAGAVEEE